MPYLLFYDTETTGLPDWQKPSDGDGQPHIVQLAASLVDTDKKSVVQSIDLIVQPDGWTIPQETTDVHGITTDYAATVGLPESFVIAAFYQLWSASTLRIAHNEGFDYRICRIAIKRFLGNEEAEKFKKGEAYCTADNATDIVQCPPTDKMIAAGRHHYKKPNLGEAFKHFTGKELKGAHNAQVDVSACMAVFWGIQKAQMADNAPPIDESLPVNDDSLPES